MRSGPRCCGGRRHVLRRRRPAAIAHGRGQSAGAGRAGPMGPTRMRPGCRSSPRSAGYAVAGGLELALWCDLRVVEQDADVRRVLPALGRAADRRRDGTAAADRRAGPGAGHDPHRPRGRRGRGAGLGAGRPGRAARDGARTAAEALAAELAALPPVCLRQRPGLGVRHGRVAAGGRRWRSSSGTGCGRWPAGRRGRRGPVRRGRRAARNAGLTRGRHGAAGAEAGEYRAGRARRRSAMTATVTDQELVVLLDDRRRPIGTAPKADVHTRTPRCTWPSRRTRSTRPGGRVLVTRRALGKRTWPGVWTNTCCGHPGPGEDPRDAMTRRIGQELGLTRRTSSSRCPSSRTRRRWPTGRWRTVLPGVPGRRRGRTRSDPAEVAEWAWVRWADLVVGGRARALADQPVGGAADPSALPLEQGMIVGG